MAKNYISINNQKIELTEEQVKQIIAACGAKHKQISELKPGETVKIGGFELVVLEQRDGETALILKGCYGEDSEFGSNNNYDGSYVDMKCNEFAKELAEIIGEENLVCHEVDLISNDGLKCYGTVCRDASLLTADRYRKYVDVLDAVNPGKWWWLATPWSTERHDHSSSILCVAPSGRIDVDDYYGDYGVRPFCILKSSIFVSC